MTRTVYAMHPSFLHVSHQASDHTGRTKVRVHRPQRTRRRRPTGRRRSSEERARRTHTGFVPIEVEFYYRTNNTLRRDYSSFCMTAGKLYTSYDVRDHSDALNTDVTVLRGAPAPWTVFCQGEIRPLPDSLQGVGPPSSPQASVTRAAARAEEAPARPRDTGAA